MSAHEGLPVWGGEREVLDRADRELRDMLEQDYLAAHEVREFRESLVRQRLSPLDMQLVDDYAEAKAREIMARRALEACGWPV